MCTNRRLFPLVCTECEDEMILPSSRGPDRAELAKACCDAETTQDTKDEPIQEHNGTTRRQNKTDRAGEGNPSTEVISE